MSSVEQLGVPVKPWVAAVVVPSTVNDPDTVP